MRSSENDTCFGNELVMGSAGYLYSGESQQIYAGWRWIPWEKFGKGALRKGYAGVGNIAVLE